MAVRSLVKRVAEAEAILRRTGARPPETVVVLGSGLGPVAEAVEEPVVVPFADLPCLPAPTVPGHAGRVLLGRLGGRSVIVFQGRVHLYEGHPHAQVIVPVVLAHRLGARSLVVTNAAGSLRGEVRPGTFVLLTDILDLADADPTGAHQGLLTGPQFTPLNDAFSPDWRARAREEAGRYGIKVREGVYAMMRGPAYETPAEIRMLRMLGADVVGMSTVPEVIAARNLGLAVLGITTVTNLAAGVEGATPSHEEVADVARNAGPQLARWLAAIFASLENGP
ncbi:MAG: purine-nucleoside phosphorylase [Deltaproteobacteria bacterium]|nr:purine-nucleoside phosphorylase [Deltaproteobacteria bacterium]